MKKKNNKKEQLIESMADKHNNKTSHEKKMVNISDYVTITDNKIVQLPTVVAKVNNKEILGETLNIYLINEVSLGIVPESLSSFELEEAYKNSLNELIETALLEQAVNEFEYQPSEDEILEYVEEVVEVLGSDGISSYSEAEVKELAIIELKIWHYLETQIGDITITDEAINKEYEKQKTKSKKVQPLKQIKEYIRIILEFEKQEMSYHKIIDDLKKSATLTVYFN